MALLGLRSGIFAGLCGSDKSLLGILRFGLGGCKLGSRLLPIGCGLGGRLGKRSLALRLRGGHRLIGLSPRRGNRGRRLRPRGLNSGSALRLRGLIPDALYRDEAGNTYTGEALMKVGLRVSLCGDYDSRFMHFAEVK